MKKEERDDGLEFIGAMAKEYFDMIARRNPEDYEIDPTQAARYKDIVGCLSTIANQMPGEQTAEFDCELIPTTESSGITMHTWVLDLTSADLRVLADVLEFASSPLSIDATLDGRIHLSVSVADVFRKKRQ